MWAFAQKRFNSWLDRRIPASGEVTLNQKRIFIFPSMLGMFFLLLVLLLLLTAINYENNLVYLLVFFLLSLFNTAILFTYQNVTGLRIQGGRAQAVFSEELAEFEIMFKRTGVKHHHRIQLSWPKYSKAIVDLIDRDQQAIKVNCLAPQRGLFKPGRLLLESYYPLGLIRCWSWLDLDLEVVVYPKPVTMKTLPVTSVEGDEGHLKQLLGQDDFAGFKTYQAGDSLKQVNWRGFAKGQSLQTKQYVAYEDKLNWVDWFELPQVDTELRLSYLCDWALQLESTNSPYALRLPSVEIQTGLGTGHHHQVLTALALFQTDFDELDKREGTGAESL